MAECDGDYTYEKRGSLLWQLPLIDSKNKTGSMEFSCGGNPDDFFPVQVAFFSKKSYSGIEVKLLICLHFCNLHISRDLVRGGAPGAAIPGVFLIFTK